MLVVTSDLLYVRTGAVFSALIVAACTIGLTMHREFYAGASRPDFFYFYTNLSNLLVGIYFALISPYLYANSSFRALIPHAEFSLMMSIMLTFSVFHLMLYPAIRSVIAGAKRTRECLIVVTDNFIVHYLVPWLVFLYWLICSPGKALLRLWDAFLWTLLPALYLAWIYLRASKGRIIKETESPYPYPFLDAAALGKNAVIRTCLTLYVLCIAAGASVVLLLRLAFAVFGSNHALILI